MCAIIRFRPEKTRLRKATTIAFFSVPTQIKNSALHDPKCKLRYCDDFSVFKKAILMKKKPEYVDT